MGMEGLCCGSDSFSEAMPSMQVDFQLSYQNRVGFENQ
jgi:hypothetical protein